MEIDIAGSASSTPFEAAILCDQPALVQLFIERGASLSDIGSRDKKVIELAEQMDDNCKYKKGICERVDAAMHKKYMGKNLII